MTTIKSAKPAAKPVARPGKPAKATTKAATQPAGKPRPVTSTPAAGPGLMPRQLDLGALRMPPMARSSTYVAVRIPTFSANQASASRFALPGGLDPRKLPAPRQHFIGPVTSTPAQRRAAEARWKAQEATNRIAQLDPFAARVNGMMNMGTDRHPSWQKIGPSPLEVVATNFGPGGQVVGAYLTTKHVIHAVEHPTVGSVGMAVVGVVGTVAGVKHPHGHGLGAKVMHGSHQAHQGMQAYETLVQPYARGR